MDQSISLSAASKTIFLILRNQTVRSSHRGFELDDEKNGCPHGMTRICTTKPVSRESGCGVIQRGVFVRGVKASKCWCVFHLSTLVGIDGHVEVGRLEVD